MRKSHGNNTDMNHTDNSHTDLSHTPSSPSMDEAITTGALQEQVGGQKALTDAHTMDEKVVSWSCGARPGDGLPSRVRL